MKNDPIPEADHISRYCPGGSLDNGKINGSSFLLREMDKYLSVNWLEYLEKNDRDTEISEVRRILSTKLQLGKTAKIAVLNVGTARDHVRAGSPERRDLRILHRPDEPPDISDPSHSGIFDTAADEQVISELIAESIIESYSAR